MHAHSDPIDTTAAIAAVPSRTAGHDDGLAQFLTVRPRLFGIAYRMLRSAPQAEDIVQDVWVRWQTTDRSRIMNPVAFLVTATTRLAINVLQSARSRRESVGADRVPEIVDTCNDPRLPTERADALRVAVQMLIERLSPIERAAFVLREAFGHPYRRIAGILHIEEANARQLVTRARERVRGERRVSANPSDQRQLLTELVTAASTGALERLESLFAVEALGTDEGTVPANGRRRSRVRRQASFRSRPARPHHQPVREPYSACQ